METYKTEGKHVVVHFMN